MKKSLLHTGAALLLFGMTQNFDGQGMVQSHRQLPGGDHSDITRHSRMAQPPFSSRQEPNRWTNDQTLPFRYRVTNPMGHRDYRVKATLTGKTLVRHELSAGVDTAWVRHYTSGRMPGEDRAIDMAIDSYGNVYVTGYSTSPGFGADFYTVKYNSSGTQIWTARYDNNRSYDIAVAICVDDAGHVYVTGYSNSSHVTIKYDGQGAEQWVNHYDERIPEIISFGGYPSPIPADLAVDGEGNVYMAGMNVTIKYDAFGREEWDRPFDARVIEHYWNEGPTALVLDDSGCVYVTGQVYRSEDTSWYKTIKYNADGAEQWQAYYDGGSANNRAQALAIDRNGNVYATGSSGGAFATVKYNASGAQHWVVRYSGLQGGSHNATAIAIDDSNYVYIAGYSNIHDDRSCATIKYDSYGNTKWIARRDRGQSWGFVAKFDIAVDRSSNVYVAGGDFINIKYDAMGIEQWAMDYNGPDNAEDAAYALALDDSGSVYVAGACDVLSAGIFGYQGGNYVTIKYNISGAEQWVDRYDGPGDANDFPSDLAVDDSGNVYVTGFTESSWYPNDLYDYFTIKYDAAGDQQWVAGYDGGNTFERATANAIDDAGNIYVTGVSAGDYLTVKYSSAGDEEWVARYDGHNQDGDVAMDIGVDKAGNVYVTGSTATIKYDAHGVQQWAVPGNGNVLILDGSGNIYVSGEKNRDCATIAFSSSGEQQWYARYSGPGNGSDYPNGITIDSDGNVYVSCTSVGADSTSDCATLKYDASGNEQWVARYQGTERSRDSACGLAIDKAGNVYVTGTRTDNVNYGPGPRASDCVTIQYDSQGIERWVACYNGTANGNCWASDIVVDNHGNAYVTGGSDGSFLTIKYDPSGTEQWIADYNGRGGARHLALDNNGNIYVTGSNAGIITTIKHTQSGTPVVGAEPKARPDEFSLAQNYPNPFNPATTIAFALPKASFVTLKIYDLLGNEVATLVAEKLPAGQHQRVWEAKGLASGVYVCRFEAGDFMQTKKLVLMR